MNISRTNAPSYLIHFVTDQSWFCAFKFLTLVHQLNESVDSNKERERIFPHKKEQVRGNQKDCITTSFITCAPRQMLLGQFKESEMSSACSTYDTGRKKKGNVGEKDRLESLEVDRRMTFKWILQK